MKEGLYYLIDADFIIRVTHVDRLKSSVEDKYVVFAEYEDSKFGRWFIERSDWNLFRDEFFYIGEFDKAVGS